MEKSNAEILDDDKKMNVAVVVVPLPAQGHLNQLLHLSHLISSYGLPVHFVGTPTHNRQARVRVHGWDPTATSKIHFHDFSTPPYPTPDPNPNTTNKFPAHLYPSFHATLHLREQFCELIRKLSVTSRRVIVIHDSLMSYVIQDVPSIPNAESYNFFSVSAFAMYSYYWEMAGKPILATGEPVNDLLGSASGFNFTEEVAEFKRLQIGSRKRNWGNLYNSNRVIDGEYLELIEQEQPYAAEKHWPIGPFNPLHGTSAKHHNCLEWLDKQPAGSVIFVSFGSTTSLCDEQVKEIAIGLEKSGVKFIWVLREADRGDVFAAESRWPGLPEGYENRIAEEGKGMVVRDWAPQLEILQHSSTGGFMSHCGWNSSMESISLGVPMAAWPMHSDQPRNAVLVTEVLKTGVRVGEWGKEGELVKAEVVEKAVKTLMDSDEGKEMRKRAAELSDAIKKSMEKGNNAEMDAFLAHITRGSSDSET